MEKQNVYVIDGEAARADVHAAADAPTTKPRKKHGGTKRPSTTAGAHGGLPRLGASCSMLVSGTGHLIHRRWKTGIFYMALFAGALATPFVLRPVWPRLESLAAGNGLGNGDLLVGLLLLDVFFVAAWLSSVHAAYTTGRACSGDAAEAQAHPLGAAAASLLVPGWGQIVNGQIGKALAFLAVVYAGALAAIAWLALPGPIGELLAGISAARRALIIALVPAVIGSVTWALSLYDALLVARYRGPVRAQVQVHSRVRRRRRRASDTVSAARSA